MPDETTKKQPDLIAVEPQIDVPCYFLELTIENVRSFSGRQKLDLSDGKGRPSRWIILLGDNGSGKTTLLQSLAAMIPQELQMRGNPDNSDKPERKHYVPEIFLNHR